MSEEDSTPQSERVRRIRAAAAVEEKIEAPSSSSLPDKRKRFLATCFPKCGTNLMRQLLSVGGACSIPFTNIWGSDQSAIPRICQELAVFETAIVAHVPYRLGYVRALESKPTIIVFLIRDPRDQIVSHYHWNLKRPDMGTNWVFPDGTTLLDQKDGILALIETAVDRWQNFLGWLKHPDIILIRYEELINNPIAALIKIEATVRGTSIWHPAHITFAGKMADRRKNQSDTFRKGIVGDWQNEFKPHHVEAFNQHCGDLMDVLGYPIEEGGWQES